MELVQELMRVNLQSKVQFQTMEVTFQIGANNTEEQRGET